MLGPFKDLPREVAVLAAVAVSVAVGFGVVAPAIPEFASSFGVGKTAAGAVISAFALMRFASALGGGRLVDAFGERVILAIGIGIVAVSTGLAGLSQSYLQLLILRGAGGIGSAMFTIAATALLFRVVGSSNRGRATGLFQSGFLIGGLLGPLAGGFLTDYSLRLPFYVYALSLIVAGGIGVVFLSSARLRPSGEQVERETSDEPATRLRTALAHPGFQAALVVNFAIGWTLFGVRMSLIPLFITEAMGQRPLWIGVSFLCASIGQVGLLFVTGKLADSRGRRPSMIIGSLVATVALVGMALTTSLPLFLAAMTGLGVAGAFIGTSTGAVVGDLMHGRGGKVVAVFQMSRDLGTITGPVVAGWLADSLSFDAAFVACAIVLVGATAMAVRMPETLQREPRSDLGSAQVGEGESNELG
ncbi:MAG: MFS transporter [Nocardioidaceae bacterium]